MAKKKKMKKLDLDGFVFSTNSDFEFEDEQEVVETLAPNEQRLIARIEKKGRGGKTVTIVEGFEGSDEDMKALAKKIKNHCGVGGSVKDEDIVIQGDHRDKIVTLLSKDGYRIKRSG